MFVVLISIILSLSLSYGAESEVGSVSSVNADINRKQNMEDYSVRIENVFGSGFYAILDGHGGEYSASYAKEFLTAAVTDELQKNHSQHGHSKYAEGPNGELNLSRMLTDFADQMEAHIIHGSGRDSGTTCLMIVAEKNKLTVGNIGDSRAVLCNSKGKAIDLSNDHKAGTNKDEERRVVEANEDLSERVDKRRIYGLAISRSLGDYYTKSLAGKNVIISEPEISQCDLTKRKPKFMILASDGLWDVITSQEAVNFIKKRYLNDSDFGAKALVEKAIADGTRDNITVMIVVFKDGSYKIESNTFSTASAEKKVVRSKDKRFCCF